MDNTVEYWENEIKNVLLATGRSPSALAINIRVLAVSLRRLMLSVEETAEFDAVSVTGVNGALQQHPAFKVQTDTENSILRQLKELSLTADGTTDRSDDADRFTELISRITNSGKTKKRIKPKEKSEVAKQ